MYRDFFWIFFENIFFCALYTISRHRAKKCLKCVTSPWLGWLTLLFIIALTLKGSCVQTLGQTKKASHFEVDLETKQKERSPSCQKRNSCETANHFYVQTGQTKKASHFEVDLETKQKQRSSSCQKRNSCETANHFYEYHAFFKC